MHHSLLRDANVFSAHFPSSPSARFLSAASHAAFGAETALARVGATLPSELDALRSSPAATPGGERPSAGGSRRRHGRPEGRNWRRRVTAGGRLSPNRLPVPERRAQTRRNWITGRAHGQMHSQRRFRWGIKRASGGGERCGGSLHRLTLPNGQRVAEPDCVGRRH